MSATYTIPDGAKPVLCSICKREIIYSAGKGHEAGHAVEYDSVRECPDGRYRGPAHNCHPPHRPEYSSTMRKRVKG